MHLLLTDLFVSTLRQRSDVGRVECVTGAYVLYSVRAPNLALLMLARERYPRVQVVVERMRYGFHDGSRFTGVKLIPRPGERVHLFFGAASVDARWYLEGLRLTGAYRHLHILPERIAALEQTLP